MLWTAPQLFRAFLKSALAYWPPRSEWKISPWAGLRLVTAFKRVSNILKGVEAGGAPPEPSLFVEPEEKGLYMAWQEAAPVMEGYWKSGEYEKVFEALASIKDRIDGFFDKVMVMAEDERLRRNRLALLTSVRGLYSRTADLSRLSA